MKVTRYPPYLVDGEIELLQLVEAHRDYLTKHGSTRKDLAQHIVTLFREDGTPFGQMSLADNLATPTISIEDADDAG